MKYWTLFTLRMISRAGLLLSVIVWAVSQYQNSHVLLSVGAWQTLSASTHHSLYFSWTPRQTASASGDIDTSNPEVAAILTSASYQESVTSTIDVGSRSTPNHGALVINHRFLCLTLFIATIATWPRGKPTTQPRMDE